MMIMIETLIQLHTKLFFWLYSFSGGSEISRFWIYTIAEVIDIYVVAIGILFILAHHHRHFKNHPEFISHTSLKEGIYIIIGVCIAWAISYGMKLIFAMPRPFLRFAENVVPLFPYGGFDSFPSGHATLFAALSLSVYLYHKKIGILFIIIALAISITRVISGVHFPIDILVGWLLGCSSVLLVRHYFLRKKTQT